MKLPSNGSDPSTARSHSSHSPLFGTAACLMEDIVRDAAQTSGKYKLSTGDIISLVRGKVAQRYGADARPSRGVIRESLRRNGRQLSPSPVRGERETQAMKSHVSKLLAFGKNMFSTQEIIEQVQGTEARQSRSRSSWRDIEATMREAGRSPSPNKFSRAGKQFDDDLAAVLSAQPALSVAMKTAPVREELITVATKRKPGAMQTHVTLKKAKKTPIKTKAHSPVKAEPATSASPLDRKTRSGRTVKASQKYKDYTPLSDSASDEEPIKRVGRAPVLQAEQKKQRVYRSPSAYSRLSVGTVNFR